MRKKSRILYTYLSMILCWIITVYSCGFFSYAEEYKVYEPIGLTMEVFSYQVLVDGNYRSGIINLDMLKRNNKTIYGGFELTRGGAVTVSIPEINANYGMSISGGTSSTDMSLTAHAGSISAGGSMNSAASQGNKTSISGAGTTQGRYVAALMSGAEYRSEEENDDGLENVVDAINLASSTGYYECFLDGTGNISIDRRDDGVIVMVYLHAQSYKSYTYGRLDAEGEGGGIVVGLSADRDINLTPQDSDVPDPENNIVHDIIVDTPPEPGEFGSDIPISPFVIAAIAGGAIAAMILGRKKDKKKKDKKEEEEPSEFKMILKKDFGDTLKKGDAPKPVYAKIVEIKGEKQIEHPELSPSISVYSYDNTLTVTDGGVSGGYKCAMASVPKELEQPVGLVTFALHSELGSFIQSVMFKITEPEIFFAQDNLGLPANKLKFAKKSKKKHLDDQAYRLPFGVSQMGEDVRVSVSLIRVGNTDIDGSIGAKTPQGIPFEVKIEQDKKNKSVFEAVIKEIMDYELPAGNSEGFRMHLIAESGTPGTDTYLKVETDFPLYRIHLGLAFTLDAASIGCYAQVKAERQGMKYAIMTEAERMAMGMTIAAAGMPDLGTDEWGRGRMLGTDLEPCYTGGSLLLFLYREEDMSVIRVPVSPDSQKPLNVRAKRLTNDRYCKVSDASESHQKMVDDLGITAFGTGELLDNGAHKIRIASTNGRLDPPIRMIAEVEIKVKYEGKEYSAKKNVLLRSQPFRIPQNMEEEKEFLKADEHIKERLLRIQDQIYDGHMSHLFSLYDMIERMLDGYEYRFGFDANQVQNVMKIWTEYLEGNFVGANATAQGTTLADELHACYAFMQGLRDNTGFLGRVAMGIMTGGISEYVFTTMTLAEELREKVFACKGDEDYGFWDGVWLGTKEFGKQIIIEYAIKGVLAGAQIYTKAVHDFDIAGYLGKLGKAYRAKVDKFDMCLQKNFKLYKAGSDAMNMTKNFFSSSAKASKAAIERETVSYEESFVKAKELSKKARSKMTPKELKMVDEYYDAMSEGMRKVRKMQKIQQRMETATTPKELALAKEQYRKIANEVWTDKNALRQLQNVKGEYAPRMRAQFNNYRENLLDLVQKEALDEISKQTGIPRDQLYVLNASSGSKKAYMTGKKVPGDRDITFRQKVLSDRTKDLDITQTLGETTVAKKLFKKMNGREPKSIEEALEFMKGKDVTYVNPTKDSAISYVFEHNLDAYEDLEGMIGMKSDGTIDRGLLSKDLHNKVINQKTVAYKGKEWFRRSDKSFEKALQLETEAANSSGKAAEALLEEAKQCRYFAQGQTVEGVRQITKQMEKIVIPRSIAKPEFYHIPYEAMKLHRTALRVGDTLSPAEFIWILENDYGLTLDGYADLMSRFLE